jgi:hypothetical protein
MAVLFRVYKLLDQVCDNNAEQKQNARRRHESHDDLPTDCRPFEMVGGREEKAQKTGSRSSTRIIVSTAAGAQRRTTTTPCLFVLHRIPIRSCTIRSRLSNWQCSLRGVAVDLYVADTATLSKIRPILLA